jgi:hypothetical protein
VGGALIPFIDTKQKKRKRKKMRKEKQGTQNEKGNEKVLCVKRVISFKAPLFITITIITHFTRHCHKSSEKSERVNLAIIWPHFVPFHNSLSFL